MVGVTGGGHWNSHLCPAEEADSARSPGNGRPDDFRHRETWEKIRRRPSYNVLAMELGTYVCGGREGEVR